MKFDIKWLGNLAVDAFGPDALQGFLVGYLKSLKIQRCLDYIHGDRDLLDSWGDKEWSVLRKLVKKSGIKDIESEFMTNLQKYRPGLMDVINMEPGGKEWLASQVAKLKARLE